jgi:putative competence-damage inducible protein
MNAEIITVGTELLLGDILNSNSQFLSRELASFGIQMLYQSTVGDNNSRLREMLALAMSRSEILVITGGLGPTPDDLTRETVCEVLGVPLVLHEESWRRIQEYFSNTGRELSPNNQKQAMLPEGCIVFPNDHGTAPGCAIEKDGHVFILLPGPPRELIPMFNEYVAPYLARYSGGTIYSSTVGVFGIPESAVAERLADLLSEANPTVAPYAKDGEVTLRVTARAADTQAARSLCEPVVAEIRSRLGANVYGVDCGSLQKAVVALLLEKGKKIATAESCTAGILSGRLTEVPGVSAVFECGIASYSNEIKHQVLGVPEELLEKYGAVSPEVACSMAVGARRVGQADLGVGITGVAGPDSSEGKPVGTVYIALADEKRTWVKKIVAGHSADDREYVRYVATSHALDLVRRYLEALPGVMAGGELLAEPEEETPVIPVLPKTGQQRRFLSHLFPWKGDAPAVLVRKIAVWLAALALLAVGAVLFNRLIIVPFQAQKEREDNQKILDEVRQDYYATDPGSVPPPSGVEYPDRMLSRFYTLFGKNEDIGGWIKIEDTHIDFPVMKDSGNGYYKDHNFNGAHSTYGVPYFDSTAALVSSQSVNRTLTIYGNNTGDGEMFSDLIQYRNLDFLKAHPIVEMNTIFENRMWKIFAVMVVDEADPSFTYVRPSFADEEEFLQFANTEIRQRSLFHTDVDVVEEDRLLFLSTNAAGEWGFAGARLVVCARAVRDGEDASSDLSGATENRGVLMPDAWESQHGAVPGYTRTTTVAATQATAPSMSETATATEETGTTTAVTGATTTRPHGTTSTSTTGTGTSTTTTNSTTEPATPSEPDGEPPAATVIPGWAPESEYMSNFRLKEKVGNTDTYKEVTVSSKGELQTRLAELVKKEMGNARAGESSVAAWQAQAVAAYTHALYAFTNNKDDITKWDSVGTALVKGDDTDNKILTAVGEVLGVKILEKKTNSPICAFYHSASAGVTADNQFVFGADLPYLKPVISEYDTQSYILSFGGTSEIAQSTYSITVEDFDAAISEWAKKRLNVSEVSIGRDTNAQKPSVYVTEWDGKYAKYAAYTNVYYITENEKKTYLTGHEVRTALGLRSHCFNVVEKDGILHFTVWGNGHGVGMSQYGAMGYANLAGWTYDQILTHYYSITASSDHQIVAPLWPEEDKELNGSEGEETA